MHDDDDRDTGQEPADDVDARIYASLATMERRHAYNLRVTSDKFLSLVRDYEAATGRYPHTVVINPVDQDEIDADIAAGAPSPQVPMLIRRDPTVPVGQPQFPLE